MRMSRSEPLSSMQMPWTSNRGSRSVREDVSTWANLIEWWTSIRSPPPPPVGRSLLTWAKPGKEGNLERAVNFVSWTQATLTEWLIRKSWSSALEFWMPLTFSWRKLKLGSWWVRGPGLGRIPLIRRRVRMRERGRG